MLAGSATQDSVAPNYRRLMAAGGLAAVLWIAAAWLIVDRNRDRQADAAVAAETAEARRQGAGIAAGIGGLLTLRGGIAATLADDEFVRGTVISQSLGPATAALDAGQRRRHLIGIPLLKRLNRFLAAASGHLNLGGLWIGDATGYAIAADNPAAPETPIGVNFADRVYFREARAGRIGHQYAFGRTTRIGGIFFSAPIMDGERFAGFVAVKINAPVLSDWVNQANAVLTDSNGVVILAKDKSLELRALPGAPVAKMNNEERQKQYARTEFPELTIAAWGDSRHPELRRQGDGTVPVLLQTLALKEFGLALTVMRPVTELAAIERQGRQLFLLLAGIGLLLIAGFTASIAYLKYMQHSRYMLGRQKEQLDAAQQLAQLGSWELDLRTSRLSWSDESSRIFEIDPARTCIFYEEFLAAVHAGDREAVDRAVRESVAGRTPGRIVHRIVLAGGIKLVQQRWHTQYDEHGEPLRVLGSVQNITESRQVESRLRLAASVFDNANEGICIVDPGERIVEVNPTLCQLTGYRREELVGQTPRLFKSGRQDARFYAAMWQAIAEQGHWHGELWNRRSDGELYAVRLNLSAVRDASGKLTHYVGIMTNITAMKRHEAQLEKIAHFDTLTGIPNRLLLADRMRQATAQTLRSGKLMAVCYLDLDGFKPINDSFGHEAGDRLLVEISRRLQACLRGGDTVARLGGDEFVVLLLGLERSEECEITLRRILEEIAKPVAIGQHSATVSASVGVVLYPQDDSDPDLLLRHADHAMYRAKHAGKNRYDFFGAAA